jgi:hypothetical protein
LNIIVVTTKQQLAAAIRTCADNHETTKIEWQRPSGGVTRYTIPRLATERRLNIMANNVLNKLSRKDCE